MTLDLKVQVFYLTNPLTSWREERVILVIPLKKKNLNINRLKELNREPRNRLTHILATDLDQDAKAIQQRKDILFFQKIMLE